MLLLPRFDATGPAVRTDPYPEYARLRTAGRVCRGGPGQWVVTRYDDVANLLRDDRLGNAFPPQYHRLASGEGSAAEFLHRIVLHQDQPQHTRLRQAMAAAFTPRTVRGLRPRIATMVDDLLRPADGTGRLEAVDALAFPLPVLVICELTGIPARDRDEVRPRAFDLGRAFATELDGSDRTAANAAVDWMRGYVGDLLRQRRAAPRDDLLSQLLAAERDGPLDPDDVIDNIVFLFFAGFETTTSMIATGAAALLDNPAELARLRSNPGLAARAVDEFVRWDAPIQSRLRFVREPLWVGERLIRSGRTVLLLIGSANRDERRFARPDRLDIGRSPNPHLSFGGGVHHCLGAHLARLEGELVFTELVTRYACVEPDGAAVREPRSAFRTFARVPLRVSRR